MYICMYICMYNRLQIKCGFNNNKNIIASQPVLVVYLRNPSNQSVLLLLENDSAKTLLWQRIHMEQQNNCLTCCFTLSM
jgi:hypothetical protein